MFGRSVACYMRYFSTSGQLGNSSEDQKVLSRKPPYHQYTKASRIRSALSRGETPKRPSATDDDIDEINDQFWDLIMGCCVREPEDRLTLSEIKKVLADMEIQDDRPETTSLPGAEALTLRSAPDINWDGVKPLIDQIQVRQLIMMVR
jgi:serine/threonine protein kinase